MRAGKSQATRAIGREWSDANAEQNKQSIEKAQKQDHAQQSEQEGVEGWKRDGEKTHE